MEIDNEKYLLLLLLIPALLLVYYLNYKWQQRKQREFGDVTSIRKLAVGFSPKANLLRVVMILLALTALVVALANPKVGVRPETVKREGIDIVFAVDVSKSMLCEDVAPNRLEKSKLLVSSLINRLVGNRIGIVAYAGSAFPVLPITTDYSVAKMYLQNMNPGMVSAQGTSLDEAIKMSAAFFDTKSPTSKIIVLISDGEDHSEGANSVAEDVKDLGIKIMTVGVGTANGGTIPLRENGVLQGFQRDENDEVVITKSDFASLGEIAGNSGGFVNGNSTGEAIGKIAATLNQIEKTEYESTQFSDYNAQFQWFLAIAFVLLIVEMLTNHKISRYWRTLKA